jgi:D-amino-acid oxidase
VLTSLQKNKRVNMRDTRNMNNQMNRRAWLQYAGISAASLALGGCATNLPLMPRAAYRASPRPLSAQPFARPSLNLDSIIRTKVGLRPYRDDGFVVRGERVNDKLIIHNYGHGGAGITLSWGSSSLAVAELPESIEISERRAVVLGAGIMGLTTARLLQARGWQVTIYSKAFSPDTTSDVAGGQWAPTGVYQRNNASAKFSTQLDQALQISFDTFRNIADSNLGAVNGVFWRENYHLSERNFFDNRPFYYDRWPQFFPGLQVLADADNPFAATHVLRSHSLLIEPAIYLPRLMTEIQEAGGIFIKREMQSLAEILTLNEPVIFNCTGLGAAQLFNDTALTPIRGQLVFAAADSRVDYLTHGGGSSDFGGGNLMYMFPRQDGILLGGTYERGATHLNADASTTARIVNSHARLFQGMQLTD